MDCGRAQVVLLMPLADAGELSDARAHVADCPVCSSTPTDDLLDGIMDSLAPRRRPWGVLRTALLVIGAVQALLALPWLFGSSPFWNSGADAAAAHLTRDGVVGLVIGLIGVSVATNARLAYFAVSVCGLMVAVQAAAYVVDRTNDTVAPGFETVHALTLTISVLVVLVAFPRVPRR